MTVLSVCNETLLWVAGSVLGSNSGSSALLRVVSLVSLLYKVQHLFPFTACQTCSHSSASLSVSHSRSHFRDRCFLTEAAAVCAIFRPHWAHSPCLWDTVVRKQPITESEWRQDTSHYKCNGDIMVPPGDGEGANDCTASVQSRTDRWSQQ